MKFIHIADVNLGAQPDRGRIWSDVRAKEIYSTFHRVIEVCEEQKIELLLIAGNLFYTRPTEQDLKELDFQLRKIPNTKTVIIAGDQDYIDPGSAWETYTFESNTIVMPRDQAASVYFEDLNVCVSGYSYGHATYTGRMHTIFCLDMAETWNICHFRKNMSRSWGSSMWHLDICTSRHIY